MLPLDQELRRVKDALARRTDQCELRDEGAIDWWT